ncbi:hypothetical protein M5689_024581 [Euphorbia peplus]|nr:hypothetical protein M5689_024581 [Euphorbia peplus]
MASLLPSLLTMLPFFPNTLLSSPSSRTAVAIFTLLAPLSSSASVIRKDSGLDGGADDGERNDGGVMTAAAKT